MKSCLSFRSLESRVLLASVFLFLDRTGSCESFLSPLSCPRLLVPSRFLIVVIIGSFSLHDNGSEFHADLARLAKEAQRKAKKNAREKEERAKEKKAAEEGDPIAILNMK